MIDAIQPVRSERANLPDMRVPPPRPPKPAPTEGARTDQFQLASTRLQFSRAEGGQVIVRVFDGTTGKLIRQIPPAERLRMAAHIASMVRRLLG